MSFTHTILKSYKTAEGTVTSTVSDKVADSQNMLDTVIPAGATNMHREFHARAAILISFDLYASKAVTVKTNSPSAPDQTFTLLAGQQIIWNTSEVGSSPVTDDITDLYFTNAGAADATVKVRALIDQPGVGS